MNDCIKLKDAIEGIIKTIPLPEYTKDGRRTKEESLKKRQSPKKTIETVAEGKGKKSR